MKYTAVILIIILVGILQAAAQPLSEIRIVNEDRKSIVLEFNPVVTTQNVPGTGGTIFTRFQFSGSQTTFDSAGRADFTRTVLLLFPSRQYSIQVLGAEFKTRDSVKVLPKPTLKSLKDFGIQEIYTEDQSGSARSSFPPRALAEILKVGKTSVGLMGRLVLRPVQVLGDGKVRIYSRLTVRIEFKDALPEGMRPGCFLRGDIPQKAQLARMGEPGLRKIASGVSPFAQGDWYRIDVSKTGMYKLDYNFFRKLNISLQDINSVRLFGNGGSMIPENNTDPRPDSLVEIPRLLIRKNSAGIDTADFLVFYGREARGWTYNSYRGDFQHYINPYTETNCYYFTVDQGSGRQMDSVISPAAALTSKQYFLEKIIIEQERANLRNSGRRWVGKEFSSTDNTDTYYISLPGIIENTSVKYLFNFVRRSATTDNVSIFENTSSIQQQSMWATSLSDGSLGDGETSPYAEDYGLSATGNPMPANTSTSVVKIQLSTGNQDSRTWLDWMEVYYQRSYQALNDALVFTTPDAAGLNQYTVTGFSSDVRAFDVTDHSSVKQIIFPQSGSSCTFQVQQTAGSVRQIAVEGKNGYIVPAAASKIEKFVPNNLHDLQNQIDFIIISPKEFLPEANRLKNYRQTHDSLNTVVVDIQQIYNEFAGGLPDPLSIREFLQYTQDHWTSPQPRYVLLFGNGYYDYKNTTIRNWVPPYEPDESFETVISYPSDDKFVMLGPANDYALAMGRLPVRNLQSAAIAVDKIISYETASPLDPWRNRITFVADDGKTSEGDDGSLYTDHSEEASEINALESFEKNKIYIVEYPTVNSGGGRRKPDANKAIVNAINSGSILTNYIGHGNDRLWAHESIFSREDDLPQLVNKERLTFLAAATCSYGWYDNPTEISSAELLMTMEQGGTIANLTAARVVYDGPNYALDVAMINNLLRRNPAGQYPRIGDACMLAKAGNGDIPNTMKFHLFGDPTIRLLMPQNIATVDSVNGSAISAVDTIRIKSLGHARVSGTMTQNSSVMSSFHGTGTLQLFDSQKDVSIVDGIGDFKFKVAGSLLYRGDVSITHGRYEAMIPVPKDVTIGKNARISMYAWSGQADGTGSTEHVMIDGIDTTSTKDTEGPVIAVYLDTTTFRPGGVVKSNPVIIVQLEDESGINTSTVGVGHQLTATISSPSRVFDLSNYYHSDLDNYKKGEVRYPLSHLADGKYSLTVKAWDVQNNSSVAETFFEVHAEDDFAILNAVNYPNPFSRATTFSFQRTSSDPIDVEIKIYSIAGRLIGTINVPNVVENDVRIPWDGKDNDGNELANGVYFYKLKTHEQYGSRSSEMIGKLAVMR